jgi:hypothetical protein
LLQFIYLGKKDKTISKQILGETTALAGATTRVVKKSELVKSLGLVPARGETFKLYKR